MVNTDKPNGSSHADSTATTHKQPLINNATSIRQSPLISSKDASSTAITSTNAATMNNNVVNNAVKSAPLMKEKEMREKAGNELYREDERRMRFLALLCGNNAFSDRGPTNTLLSNRERSDSMTNRERSNSLSKERSNSTAEKEEEPTDPPINQNYTPTTPQNLSRRILHTQGVGYYDSSVSLLLSCAADRFLAQVLTQAKFCRDRRLEGALRAQSSEKRKRRHLNRVRRERGERERRFQDEVDRMKKETGDGASAAKSSEGARPLKQPELDRLKEFRKNNVDLDAEEDYYRDYFGATNNAGDAKLEDDNLSENEESDDETEEKQDLLLRDVIRPLSAWGYDLSSKIGFDPQYLDDDDEEEDVSEEKDEDNEDGEDGDENEEDDDDGEDGIDNDEGENRKSSPVKKKKKAASPTKKKADATSKKASKKRKAEDAGGEDGKAPAKKAATAKSTDDKPTVALVADTDKKPPKAPATAVEPPSTEKSTEEKK